MSDASTRMPPASRRAARWSRRRPIAIELARAAEASGAGRRCRKVEQPEPRPRRARRARA